MWTLEEVAVDGSVDKPVENSRPSGEKCPHPVDILGMAKTAQNDCRKALVHPLGDPLEIAYATGNGGRLEGNFGTTEALGNRRIPRRGGNSRTRKTKEERSYRRGSRDRWSVHEQGSRAIGEAGS
jgi:hypothetical protein